MAKAERIIKKYANRRLYDTESSQSITLQDVRELIGAGHPIKVVEAKTDKDVTRSVLLQIVADQELLGRPVLSNEFLEAMIRVNSNPMRDLTRGYLEKVMTHLESQQDSVEQAWSKALKKSGLGEVGSLAFEPFRQFQNRMFALWSDALSPPLRDSSEQASNNTDDSQ
ncbi:MAG: polyhydroxyalkanoate synthesis repressor PhaR [Wenzhouxiangella sp.]|nr:polyhydroxyalkanoate synthesis repressor PhaR [Wenzhouxiangella sp.]MCH8478772.1 polyhydroxyalkanoate synthesis repressor PhaR [Wenzhouxiangella sp.]TVR94873.1 MAG: polyhydroxyalkanoate synthesis repressor PhaR [Wenzhouxiangellaceae bacterium]